MQHILFAFVFIFASTCATQDRALQYSSEKIQSPVRKAEPEITVYIDALAMAKFIDLNRDNEHADTIALFYTNRGNETAWFKNGKLSDNGTQLLQTLQASWGEGLPGEYYGLPSIELKLGQLMGTGPNMEAEMAQIDLQLTKAYIDYASDISTGRINPGHLNAIWEIYPHKQNLIEYLKRSLEKNNISESLSQLRPKYGQYGKLVEAYQKMVAENELHQWPLPGELPKLEKNDSLPEVSKVKKYLQTTGYLHDTSRAYLESNLFDEQLEAAVKIFQERHGLGTDGVVGKNTLAEMNKPLGYRLAQIKLNLDRLRWLPVNFKSRDVVVNIPDYSLEYFENGELAMRMNVVVGRGSNYTPALNDTMTYIVFNPTWNVPRSIALNEILPKQKADSSYLGKKNFKLLNGSYASKDVVDPKSVDWSGINRSNFHYSVVQKPGNTNSLGRIKFMLPNNHNIYLHDTPADYLFNRAKRNFSHGCVRLEKPFELAEKILQSQITTDEVRQLSASRKTKSVVLKNPVAVHLIYQTAWVDDRGILQFRNDIYGFDDMSLPLFETPMADISKL